MYLVSYVNPIKVKVKFTLQQITGAQTGNIHIALLLWPLR